MDSLTLESWLKVYYNDLILTKILEYFDLKQQIVLLSVSERFYYVLCDIIWKRRYKDISISKKVNNFFIEWDEPAATSLIPPPQSAAALSKDSKFFYEQQELNQCELYEWLKHICGNFKSLTVKSVYGHQEEFMGVVFDFQGDFKNLKTLNFQWIVINDVNLKAIIDSCKALKQLKVEEIQSQLKDISCLSELSSLEKFSLDHAEMLKSYKELICVLKLPLKSLRLNSLLFDDESTDNLGDTECLMENIENLTLDNFVGDYFLNILRKSSKPFGKIRDLQIHRIIIRDENFIKMVAEKCISLQRLTLFGLQFNVDLQLAFPQFLRELYVEQCDILTPENGWYILTQLKDINVLCLSYIDSRSHYNFDYSLDMGTSLKTLKIEPFRAQESDKEFWFEILKNCSTSAFRQVENFTLSGPATTDAFIKLVAQQMPYVQYFFIENTQLTGKYVDRFEKLKLLSINASINIDLWHFMQIIKSSNATLESILLQKLVYYNTSVALPSSKEEYSLQRLNFEYDDFIACPTFWLHLLRSSLTKIDLLCNMNYFTHKTDWQTMSDIFVDKSVWQNIQRFVLVGILRFEIPKIRRWFIEMLYEQPIRDYIKCLLINEIHIDKSMSKSECFDFVAAADSANSAINFRIKFK